MFGSRRRNSRSERDEPEKPFWISFADLMTALMVLFLVVMSAALLAATQKVTTQDDRKKQREDAINKFLDILESRATQHSGISIHKDRHVIDFGQRARFPFGDWRLSPPQEVVLRQFVPEILDLAQTDLGKSVLKRVVIEGYTDRTGSYLSNLDLSLKRSQKVLCVLFSSSGQSLLTWNQKVQVRELFFVGGYSFNASKDTDEESRRVELRLEFLGVDEERDKAPSSSAAFGDCAI